MALAGALCLVVHAVTGITNKSLRGQVTGLLGRYYSSAQMSYDLRRVRLHGLITRVAVTNTYTLTPAGVGACGLHPRSTTDCSDHSSRRIDLPRHLSSSSPWDHRARHRGCVTNAKLGVAKTCHSSQRLGDQEGVA